MIKKIFANTYNMLEEVGSFIFMVAHPVRWVKDDISKYFDREVKKIDTHWGIKLTLVCNTLEDYIQSMIQSVLEPVPIKSNSTDIEMYKRYVNGPARLLV